MVEAIKQWLDAQGLEDARLYYEKFSDSNTSR
jgi:anthranilate 1,2-dioxygenase reductase subunit